jgi:hypothetical protein
LGLGGIGEAFQDDNFRRYSLGSILSWTSYFVQAGRVTPNAIYRTYFPELALLTPDAS